MEEEQKVTGRYIVGKVTEGRLGAAQPWGALRDIGSQRRDKTRGVTWFDLQERER